MKRCNENREKGDGRRVRMSRGMRKSGNARLGGRPEQRKNMTLRPTESVDYSTNAVNAMRKMKGQPGRRETEGTRLLSGIMNKSRKQLKKEYKRCQTIRIIKKFIRSLSTNTKTKKIRDMINWQTDKVKKIWKRMYDIYERNEDEYTAFSKTEAGPKTDGRSYRKRCPDTQPNEKSFNEDFCKAFYAHEQMLEFHHHAACLMYGETEEDVNPAALCSFFKERCCFNNTHSEECYTAWKNVRKYIFEEMMKELGYTPFSPPPQDCSSHIDPGIEIGRDIVVATLDYFLRYGNDEDVPELSDVSKLLS